MHRCHHFGGNDAGDASALQRPQHLVQVFQRQRAEQVGFDLHYIFIGEYHVVLLVEQLAGLQHQPVGIGVFPGGDDQNIAVTQRDHVSQRRHHRRAVIKVDVVAARVHLRVVVQEDDGRLHRLVVAGLHQPHRVVQYDIIQPVALLVGFQLLQRHLGLYQYRDHLDIPRTHHAVRKLLAAVDIPAAVQGVDQVLGKATPVVAQQKAHRDLPPLLLRRAQLFHRPLHPAAQFVTDEPCPVDDMRYRRYRCSRARRDLLNGRHICPPLHFAKNTMFLLCGLPFYPLLIAFRGNNLRKNALSYAFCFFVLPLTISFSCSKSSNCCFYFGKFVKSGTFSVPFLDDKAPFA